MQDVFKSDSSSQSNLVSRYQGLLRRLRAAEKRFDRPNNSVCLVAVSKTYPARDIRTVAQEGQQDFGENQVRDALAKIPELGDLNRTWHFIGPIQSNKCRDIAQNFDWIHSVERLKIARRLSELRPVEMEPLNILLQVNLQNEATKAGISPDAVIELAATVLELPNIRLRGLMAIPTPENDFDRQRSIFSRLRELQERTCQQLGISLDCLSMGMTDDLEAAVAEGATHVRIGTAIFGPRQKSETEKPD
jgi:pyridoxal phosphate enzyme (YggS family)